jgi:tRNA A37 methylthiotransferase MiaB
VIIRIADIVGDAALTREEGERLFTLVAKEIGVSEVTLDFQGVNVYGATFFNVGIGQLLSVFTPERLRERLKIINLAPHGADTLVRVIENSKRFYGHL